MSLLLLLGDGCTIGFVACCWCFETGIALEIEVNDKMMHGLKNRLNRGDSLKVNRGDSLGRGKSCQSQD